MKAIKKLTGETVIYGMPSIIGRFLNWWLNPYWTHVFLNQSDLGSIINIYAYVAFLFVILTYGMETGFFRFAAKSNDQKKVFSTSVLSLIFTSFSFVLLIFAFRNDVAAALEIAGRTDFVMIMAVTVAFDVISTIPFAKLRLQHRPVRFAYLKFINIGLNIGFNLFFLSLCPYLAEHFSTGIFSKIYNPNFGIGYVFLSNLIASVVTLFLLLPEMKIKWKFDFQLLRKMIGYSFPIFIVGITGMINQNIDKILLPKLLDESLQPLKQLGIYGTAFKMAVLLNMFIQAFRFAFEPFFFSQTDEQGSKKIYALIMKYFSIFGMVIFLGISTFIDLIMKIVSVQYREGAGVVPIILMANFFMGIYFTLSLWYKITDKTRYGAYMGILGSVVTIVANILLIPYIGYYGSAVAILLCFMLMTATSYLLGKKHYPVPYNLKNFFFYLITGTALFLVYWFIRRANSPQYGIAAIVNLVFWFIIFIKEKKQFKALFFEKE